MASSRVGTSTRPHVCRPPPPSSLMRCSIGSANAAVLPVPVAAWPSRSRPSSSSGIVSRCTGVGSSYPSAAVEATMAFERPSAAKPAAGEAVLSPGNGTGELLVGALEVGDLPRLALPHARADLFDQVLVVRDQQDGAFELLQRDVQRVDRLE